MAKRRKENILKEVNFKEENVKTMGENIGEKVIEISYNPYTYETLISGINYSKNSKLKELISKNSDKNLQTWYKELIKKLSEELNSRKFLINFKGRELDFIDLQDEINLLNKEGWNLGIKYRESKLNNENMFNTLENFVLDIKENAPKELLKLLNKENVFEEFYKSKDSDAYVSVIATMSSGKSTLINGILGKELLPSKNEACTATICNIKDIDEMENFRVRVEDLESNVVHEWQEATNQFLEEVNEKGNEKGLNIFLEGDIPGISSQEMNLVMIDTPGPNNSQNQEHKKATYKFIKDNTNNPLVLYVMNATQHATNDDNNLLGEIAEIINNKGKQAEERFLFALNKIDAFDPEREDISKLVENNRKYLISKGIKNPKIFPISAEFAKLKKISMTEDSLTRTQRRNLTGFKDTFIPDESDGYKGIDTIKYASISNREKNKLYSESKINEDKSHLHYSGLSAIEHYIDNYVSKYAKTQKVKDAINSLKKVLDTKYSEIKTIHRKTDEELKNIKMSILKTQNLLANQGEKELKIVKDQILNINPDDNGFKKLLTTLGVILSELEVEFNDTGASQNKAKGIIEEAMRKLENLSISAETTIEGILIDEVQNKAEIILETLKKYFNDLLGKVEMDTDLSSTIVGTFELEISSVNKMVNSYTREEEVYVGQKFSHTRKTSKWYNPFSWGSTEDVYVDEYKKVEKVNLNEIFYNEISPIGITFREKFDIHKKDLNKQIMDIKEKGILEVDHIKNIIDMKLIELDKQLIGENVLESKQSNLKNDMNSILNYKENLDIILSL